MCEIKVDFLEPRCGEFSRAMRDTNLKCLINKLVTFVWV